MSPPAAWMCSDQPCDQLRFSDGQRKLRPSDRADGPGGPDRQRDPLPPPRGRHLLRRIEQATRQTIEPMEIPTNEIINRRRVTRFHERITAGMAHREIATFAGLVEQYRKENDMPLEQIAASLAVLAAGETPLLLTDERPPAGFADAGDGRDSSRRDPGSGRSERPARRVEWAR